MAGYIINLEALDNPTFTAIPQSVKDSEARVDRFLGIVANALSSVVFRWGTISQFRMTNNTPEFPFSSDLSYREKIQLSALLNGVSSDRSW